MRYRLVGFGLGTVGKIVDNLLSDWEGGREGCLSAKKEEAK